MTPDKWLIVKILLQPDYLAKYVQAEHIDSISYDESKKCYVYNKVFASWHGSLIDPDNYKINSGILKVEDCGEYYNFHGYSGSVYKCYKKRYGATEYGLDVLNDMVKFNDKLEGAEFQYLTYYEDCDMFDC